MVTQYWNAPIDVNKYIHYCGPSFNLSGLQGVRREGHSQLFIHMASDYDQTCTPQPSDHTNPDHIPQRLRFNAVIPNTGGAANHFELIHQWEWVSTSWPPLPEKRGPQSLWSLQRAHLWTTSSHRSKVNSAEAPQRISPRLRHSYRKN